MDVHNVGIRPVEKLLGDDGNLAPGGTGDGVVPLHEFAVHLPVGAVQGELGPEEGKLLADTANIALSLIHMELGQEGEDLFLNGADVVPCRAANVETVAPAELTLYGEDGVVVLVIDIVAVEPGEKTLFEKQTHGKTFLSGDSSRLL